MCFSANASFTSAIVLTVVGIASLRHATTSSQRVFGSIPFIFAIQQLAEGVVWLSFTNIQFAIWQMKASYAFLIFAHVVWPVWIPFSIMLLEKNQLRKNILCFLCGTGVVLSTYFAVCLAFYTISVGASGAHIEYALHFPAVLFPLISVFYGMATVLPGFVSSVKRMQWLSLFITVSYIATYIFYQDYLTSVWCFFAALISVIIYWILQGLYQFRTGLTVVKMEVSTG